MRICFPIRNGVLCSKSCSTPLSIGLGRQNNRESMRFKVVSDSQALLKQGFFIFKRRFWGVRTQCGDFCECPQSSHNHLHVVHNSFQNILYRKNDGCCGSTHRNGSKHMSHELQSDHQFSLVFGKLAIGCEKPKLCGQSGFR